MMYRALFKKGNFPGFTVGWETSIVLLELKFPQMRNTSPEEIVELCFI